MPLPKTPGHSQASLGQSLLGSLLLSPGSWYTHVSVYALQESVSPVLCNFWQLYGGVNGDLVQEGLYHTQVYCTQSPSPCSSPLLTGTSAGDTQTQFCLSLCGVSGSWGLSEPSEHLWKVWGLFLNAISPLLTSCCRKRQRQPTPVLLPGKSHGRRSLIGCSSWGREELGTTE